MGHQAEHRAGRIGEAGHRPYGAIGIGLIAEHHAARILQLLQLAGIYLVAALSMGDWQVDRFTVAVAF